MQLPTSSLLSLNLNGLPPAPNEAGQRHDEWADKERKGKEEGDHISSLPMDNPSVSQARGTSQGVKSELELKLEAVPIMWNPTN